MRIRLGKDVPVAVLVEGMFQRIAVSWEFRCAHVISSLPLVPAKLVGCSPLVTAPTNSACKLGKGMRTLEIGSDVNAKLTGSLGWFQMTSSNHGFVVWSNVDEFQG